VLGGMPRVAQGLIAFAIFTIALAIVATNVNAATSRAEYVAQVDPICQAGQGQEFAAQHRAAKKLHRLRKHERSGSRKARKRTFRQEDRLVSRLYDFIAAVEEGVNAQIAAITPAIEDTSLVQVWLRVRGEKVVATQRVARAFAKGDPLSALILFFDAEAKTEEAGDISRDLGFGYCSAPSKEIGF
jgi:hypothetical protein